MNMSLVAPKTAAIMALDDDSVIPTPKVFQDAYAQWRLGRGVSNVGLEASRGAPIYIPNTSIGAEPFCFPVYGYLGHPHCVDGRSWIVENPFIYHEAYAREYTSKAYLKLRAFVKEQPSHPDDLAFGTFVNWASGGPAVCSDGETAVKRNALQAQNGAAKRQGQQFLSRTDPLHGRRRLGLAGGPEWLFLRTHGAMWILYYFGGFYHPSGCWVEARSKFREMYTLPPDNKRQCRH